MPTSLEYILISANRLVSAIGRFDPKSRIERVEIEQAIQSLKQIFFFASDVMSALREIESGRPIDVDEAQSFSDYFSDLDKDMQEIMGFLDPYRFSGNTRLDVNDVRFLSEVRYNKINVRKELSRFFRAVAQDGRRSPAGAPPDDKLSMEASRIIAQIERLNRTITTAEKRLRAAYRGR